MIFADQRWVGEHGIGRFARHVLAGFDHCGVRLSSNPASPLDPVRLTLALSGLGREDLFYSPGYNSPLSCRAPFILTIHDLNHLDRPENSDPLKRLYYATILKRACHRAKKILTVSEFSRRRIVDWAGVGEEKVLNVGNGVSQEYGPRVAPMRFEFPFLLCATSRKPHKNDFRVAAAFARARLAGLHLVFTGSPSKGLAEQIERLRIGSRAHFMGVVSEEKMPSLYRAAEATIFASLYEGFGLPLLESMASGVPVVTSNTTALPEVAGNAALLVDPTSVGEIAAAMERIVTDLELRKQLVERGLSRAAEFPWSRTVAKAREVLWAQAEAETEGVGNARS
jgi:glycosyltransferase involved in cell wall biosynthesis